MFNYIYVNPENNMIQSVVQLSEAVSNPNYLETRDYDMSIVGRTFISMTPDGVPQLVPLAPMVPEDQPEFWWIDKGPFYDRFGADALAIAASETGPCRAVEKLTNVRKYVDLKDQKIEQMLDMLIALQQPEAQPWAPGSGPMTAAKKAAILTTPTTEKERYIKNMF